MDNEMLHSFLVFGEVFLQVFEEVKIFTFTQLCKHFIQSVYADKASSLRIEITPDFNERVDVNLFHWKGMSFTLSRKGVDQNGDEKVQEDLRNNDLESQEVGDGEGMATPIRLSIILHDRLVVSIFVALENYAVRSSGVKHKGIPTFTSSCSEQK